RERLGRLRVAALERAGSAPQELTRLGTSLVRSLPRHPSLFAPCRKLSNEDYRLLREEAESKIVVAPSEFGDGLLEGLELVLAPVPVEEILVEEHDRPGDDSSGEELEHRARRAVKIAIDVHEADR